MTMEKTDKVLDPETQEKPRRTGKAKAVLKTNIADSIDTLVEYLVDNNVKGIHPLIMGEVEKRLIIKVLERSRGNKLRAAKWLGMSRNTFHRKIQKLADSRNHEPGETES
jgi:DNA-binding protein Fis